MDYPILQTGSASEKPSSYLVAKTTLLVWIVFLTTSSLFSQNNRIHIAGRDIFVNGGNIAWIDFARDIGPGNTRLDLFEEMFQEMHQSGGNSFRLWLHTNGVSTPQFAGSGADATVVGPGVGAIDDLRAILDLAYKYDIALKLCLWSFDMLQSGLSTSILERNRALFTNDEKLAAYIDNALIPMVDALKGHPAILAWEIFNEPEGMSTNFGWTHGLYRVNMSLIQKFINRTTGAIKRTDPDVFVTNGSWSFRASSDRVVNGVSYHNYYRDDRLVAAGGDELGVLDFYSVHYYKHFGQQQSPFSFDASHWQLDKPIVIGEFYLSDPRGDGNPDSIFGVNWQDFHETLYERGYAGAMGWQWFDWYANRTNIDGVDGTLSWPRMLENIRTMVEKYPEDVVLFLPGLRIEFNADDESIEKGQSTWLRWSTRDAASVTLNGAEVAFTDSLKVSPDETITYTLSATDIRDNENFEEISITIDVVDPAGINRVLNRPVQSNDSNQQDLPAINDGNGNTVWQSTSEGAIDVVFDMQRTIRLTSVEINWETPPEGPVSFWGSFDGFNWFETASDALKSSPLEVAIRLSPNTTRFLKVSFENTQSVKASISDVNVIGTTSGLQAPMGVFTSPTEEDYVEEGFPVELSLDLHPGSETITSVQYFANNLLIESVDTPPFSYSWTAPEAGNYTLHALILTETFQIRVPDVILRVRGQLQYIRFEAESAQLTGSATVQSHSAASGGGFVRMQNAANTSLTWNEILINDTDNYLLRIGFRLPFDDPKGQYLHVNGVQIEEVMFTGNLNQWLYTDIEIPLVSGNNSIAFTGSWGWMDFDYIEIRGQNLLSSLEDSQIATGFKLEQNSPNPFNPSTVIGYHLETSGQVRLEVFDLLGRKVATLINGRMPSGYHQAIFVAEDLSSGVYIYRLQANDEVFTRKMMLLK